MRTKWQTLLRGWGLERMEFFDNIGENGGLLVMKYEDSAARLFFHPFIRKETTMNPLCHSTGSLVCLVHFPSIFQLLIKLHMMGGPSLPTTIS